MLSVLPNAPLSEEEQSGGPPPNDETVPVSGTHAKTSLDALYKEFYYDRQIRKILEGSGGGAAASDKQIRSRIRKKLRLRILYNGLILVALLYAVLSISMSWFMSNIAIDTKSVDFFVYNSTVPAYLNANFNNADLQDYSNEKVTLAKAITPGDIIKLSVFLDLKDIPNIKAVEITVQNTPPWLTYVPDSAALSYANITGASAQSGYQLTIDKTPCGTGASPPVLANGSMTFRIDIPNGYNTYDGLCLDFALYFADDLKNQNMYMNQTVQMRFIAADVS